MLDPHQDLEEVLRVLPYWPRDRYLELAPKHWRATRAKLNPDELDSPLSAFKIPAPIVAAAAAELAVAAAE